MENFSFFSLSVFGSIEKNVKRKLSYLVWHEIELLSAKFSRKQFLFYLKLNKESKKKKNSYPTHVKFTTKHKKII